MSFGLLVERMVLAILRCDVMAKTHGFQYEPRIKSHDDKLF